MTFQKFAGVTLTAAFIALGAANPAAAATPVTPGSWVYDFGALVTGKNAPSIADMTSFARLSVYTENYKDFIYTLKVGSNLNEIFGGSSVYIKELSVNTSSSTDPRRVSLVDGGVDRVTLDSDNQTIGGVKYDFTNTLGNSKDKLTQGENLQWTTSYSRSLTKEPATVFGVSPFVLGVNGITYSSTTRMEDDYSRPIARTNGSGEYLGRIVSSVPEPESYAMLISGLALLGFIARRRQRSN